MPIKLSPSTKGAVTELTVACDLLSRGWSVFRSLSPASPHDLVATRESEVYRIEVKSIKPDTLKGINADLLAYLDGDQVVYRSVRLPVPEDLPTAGPAVNRSLAAEYRQCLDGQKAVTAMVRNLLADGFTLPEGVSMPRRVR
jgi:PD-(D/E)XK endonuclease